MADFLAHVAGILVGVWFVLWVIAFFVKVLLLMVVSGVAKDQRAKMEGH